MTRLSPPAGAVAAGKGFEQTPSPVAHQHITVQPIRHSGLATAFCRGHPDGICPSRSSGRDQRLAVDAVIRAVAQTRSEKAMAARPSIERLGRHSSR